MASLISQSDTIVRAMKRRAEEDPDREAFLFVDKFGGKVSLSRKDVWDKSRKFAATLKRLGVKKGDIVCNTLVNSPERLITSYGTMTAGASSMHGQLLLANFDDLLQNLKRSECRAIIVDEDRNDAISLLKRISYKDAKTGEVCYKDLPYLKTVIKLKVYSEAKKDPSSRWLANMGDEKEMFEEETVGPDDVAAIFNTSGTTGFSKLVPHKHGKLLAMTSILYEIWKVEDGDVLYSNRSLGWLGGFVHYYNTFGNKSVFTNQAYGAPDDLATHMIKIFETEIIHHANLAGIEIERVLNKLQNPLPRLLKTLLTSGGPIATFIEKAFGKMSHQIFYSYGSTEFGYASGLVFEKGSSFENFCTGNLFNGVEIKIIDDNSEPVSIGQHGEIFVRSYFLTDHYLNNPEKTKESFLPDGWFRTGDMGYQDKEGRYFVLGRKMHTVMKGSFVLYTGWLEAKILKCPGIQSLAIVGVPDPILYEEVCLCIVKSSDGNLTEEVVREFCENLFLGTEKDEIVPIPKYYLFFDDFPFNANSKLDRATLKAEASRRLGLKNAALESVMRKVQQ